MNKDFETLKQAEDVKEKTKELQNSEDESISAEDLEKVAGGSASKETGTESMRSYNPLKDKLDVSY